MISIIKKQTIILATALSISLSTPLAHANTGFIAGAQSIIETGATNLVQSTPWDWIITLGSAYGAAHGLYNGNKDQALGWGISFLISLTGQLTRATLPLRMARFVAPAILISYRTGILAKLAQQLHGLTGIEATKKAQEFFTQYPEASAAVAGILSKLAHGVNKY